MANRATIQKAMTPRLQAATAEVVKELGLDLINNPNHRRRLLRAIVGMAVAEALGTMTPQAASVEVIRSVSEAVAERQKEAAAQGNPFGPPSPASA